MEREQRSAYASYTHLLEKNLARELARDNLPVSLYTEWYWQIDLHNLFHFLRLRMDAHSQYEIRVYAEAMAQVREAVAPLAYEAFDEHVLGSLELSRAEVAALGAVMAGLPSESHRAGAQEIRRKADANSGISASRRRIISARPTEI